MRILMVVRRYSPWVGGTERQAQKLSDKLAALGVDVRVVTGWWFRGTPRQEIIGRVPVDRNFTFWEMFGVPGLRKFGGYTYLLSLLGYLRARRDQFDLIHVHLLNYHAYPAVLAGRWWRKPTIIKLANSGRRSDLARMQLNELPGQTRMLPAILRADRFVAINHESEAELRAAGVAPDRIVSIPNGVEVEAAPRRDHRVNGHLDVLYVGRLHAQKGVDVLLSALRRASDRRPELKWRLHLAGDGPARPALEQQAEALGLGSQVRFLGQVDDVSEHLARAHVFALPSRTEGISNALLEAMAHGLPCVATAIGGNTDVIHHGRDGWLVPADDPDALAESLLSLSRDESLRRALGAGARQTAEAEFGLDRVAQRYLDLYRSLLNH
jgi:glycosyltransferase involved in cell wall biosynthesis